MKKKIQNKWQLRNYLNTADMSLTNSLIAKYLYDNHLRLMHESINSISKSSDFSQSSLQRFMQNVANTDLLSYRTQEFLTAQMFTNFFASLISMNDEDIIEHAIAELRSVQDKKKELDLLSKIMISKRHILFLGSEYALSCISQLQSALLFKNIPSYSPYDFSNHEFYIKNMKENDAIVVIAINNEFSKNDIVKNNLDLLQSLPAQKILLTTIHNYKFQKYFDFVINLETHNEFFSPFKLTIFFKLLEARVISAST